jgi:acyl-CoA thioesterase
LDTHEFDAKPAGAALRSRPRSPLHEVLEIHFVEASAGRARLEMVVAERHMRTFGMLHGGVMATLLDAAMGSAAMTLAPAENDVVTVQLNVNFIRAAWEGEALAATSEILHAGRRTAVARSEIRTSEGALVATGTGTFMFISLADPAHKPPAKP